jgi:polyferredoxin
MTTLGNVLIVKLERRLLKMKLKRRKLLVIFILPAIVMLFMFGWLMYWIEAVEE